MKKNRWQDYYARQAKKKGWLARSIFKLEEIDSKYHLFQKGSRVLDLGCYPGSWSQYVLTRVGPKGEVIGLDLKEPESLKAPNFRFYKFDVLAVDIDWLVSQLGKVNAVLSDLAPSTSGIRAVDAARSIELADRALKIALAIVAPSGSFLCKVFESEDLREFRSKVSRCFRTTTAIRPKAVRKGSREIYVIGKKRINS